MEDQAPYISAPWWPFEGLEPHGYDLIMADPPVAQTMRSKKGEKKSPQAQYQTLTIDQLAAMPVGELASKNCALVMWWTWPLLLDGGNLHGVGADAERSPAGRLMKAWGFRYSTGGAWHKRRARGGTAFGPGYRFRSACEPFLLGLRGNPVNTRGQRNLIDGLAREHSRKPDEMYAALERWMPGARRLDLFSRQRRPGWTSWGNEVDKFEPAEPDARRALNRGANADGEPWVSGVAQGNPTSSQARAETGTIPAPARRRARSERGAGQPKCPNAVDRDSPAPHAFEAKQAEAAS